MEPMVNAKPRTLSDSAILGIATGFGIGHLPGAPGTWGSLLGMAAAWGVSFCPWEVRLIVAIVTFLIGIPLCQKACTLLGTEDPGSVVFDEIVGCLWTMLLVPFSLAAAIVGFILFRLFDTTKPWPIHRFEALHGGLGVMADDLAAALAAGGSLWVVTQVLSEAGVF